MDFLKGFTTLDEVGEDSQVRKQNFKPATAAEEIDYLNVILANIEKQNAKDNSSVELIPNGNSNSVTVKQNGCTDVEGSNAVTCELSHVDDILTQARRRDHHMFNNNNLTDSVNGHVQSGLSTEPTTHVLLNSSSKDSDGNFSHSCVSADVDEDLNINVGAISLAVLNNDDCQGDDEAGCSELSPSTADASLIIPSVSGVNVGGEVVLESGYDPARDTSYGCLSGKEDLAVSSKGSPFAEKAVTTNIVLRGIHELLADPATDYEDSTLHENAIEQLGTCGETVEQLGTLVKESVDKSSVCVGSFEESVTSCEESFEHATTVCEESFDQSTISCSESFDQSACEVSFDRSVCDESFKQLGDTYVDNAEQSKFVGENQNQVDLSIVKSEPLDADPGEDFDFDSFIHDPGENFRIKEEPRSEEEEETQDYSSSVNPGFESATLFNIKMEESEPAEPYVPEQRFKVKNKFYNKEQVTAAYLISQSTLSASVDMEMFRDIGKTEPVLKLDTLEMMIKKPEILVTEEADVVKLFAKNFGCNIDEWKVKHKFKYITARKHTIKKEKKKTPKGRKQKEKSQKNQGKDFSPESDFFGVEKVKGKKGKHKKEDHSKSSAVIKKKSHKKKESDDKSAHSETDSVKKRKKKLRTLSKEVVDSDSSDSEPEQKSKKQQKVSDSCSNKEEFKKLCLKKELKLDKKESVHRDAFDSESSSSSSEAFQNESEDEKPNKLEGDTTIKSCVGMKESSKIKSKRKSRAEDIKYKESELSVTALGICKEFTNLSNKEMKQNERCAIDKGSETTSKQVEGFTTKKEVEKAFKVEENESEKEDMTDGELNLNVTDIINRLEIEEETTSSDCVDIKNKCTVVACGADETDLGEEKVSETKSEKGSLKESKNCEFDKKPLTGKDNVKIYSDVEHVKSSQTARTKVEAVEEDENKVATSSGNVTACDNDSNRAQENYRTGTTVSEDIVLKDIDKCKTCVVRLTDLMLIKEYQKFVRKSLKRLGLKPKVQIPSLSPLKMLDIDISGEKTAREKPKEAKDKNKKTERDKVKDKEPEIIRKRVEKDKRILKDLEEERARRHFEKSERKIEKERKRQQEEEEKSSLHVQFPLMETNFRIPKKKGSTGTCLQELRHEAKSVSSVVSKREDVKKAEKTSMYASSKTFINRRDDNKKERARREEGVEQDDINQSKQNNQSRNLDSKTSIKGPPSPPVSQTVGEWIPAWVEGKEAQKKLENIPNQKSLNPLKSAVPDMGGWKDDWNAADDGMGEDNHYGDDYIDNEDGNSPEENFCSVEKSLEKGETKPSMLEFVHSMFEKPHEEDSIEEKPSLLSFVNELYGKNERIYDSQKGANETEFYVVPKNKKIDHDKQYNELKIVRGVNAKDFTDGPPTSEKSGEAIEPLRASTSSSAFEKPSSKDDQNMREKELFLKVLAMEEEKSKTAASERKSNTNAISGTGLDANQENIPSLSLQATQNVPSNKEQPSGDTAANDSKAPELVVSKKKISPGEYLVKKTRPPGAPVVSQTSHGCLSGVEEKRATVNAEAVLKAKMLALPSTGDQVKGVKEPCSLEGESASSKGEEDDDMKRKLEYSSLDRRQKIKLYEKRKKAYYEAKNKFLQEKNKITSHQQKRARFEECERLKKEYYSLKMYLYEEKKKDEARKREEHEKHKKTGPDIKEHKSRISESRRHSNDSKVDEYDPENAPLLELPPDPDDNDAPYSPTGSPIVDEIYHINTRTSLLDDHSSFKESIAKIEQVQKGNLNTITKDESENLQSMVLALLENIKQIPASDTHIRGKALERKETLLSVSKESKSATNLDKMLKGSQKASLSNLPSVSVTSTTVQQPTPVPPPSKSSVPIPVPPPSKSSLPTPVPPPSKSSVPTPVPPPNKLMLVPAPAPVRLVLTSSSTDLPTPVPPPLSTKLLPTSLPSQLPVPGKEAKFPLAQSPVPPQSQVHGKEVHPPPLPPTSQPPPPPPDELQPPLPPPPPEESKPPLPPPPNLSSRSSSNSALPILTYLATEPIPALRPPPPPPCIPSITETFDSVPMDLDSDMECESGGEEEPIIVLSEHHPKEEKNVKSTENISYSHKKSAEKDKDDASFLASFGVILDSSEAVEVPSLSDVVNDYFGQKPYAASHSSTNPDESINDSFANEPSERLVSCETFSVSSTPSHTSGVSKAFTHSKDSVTFEKELSKKLFSEDEILETVQGTDEMDLEVIFTNVKKEKKKTVGDEALGYYQKATLAQPIIDQCKNVPLVGLQYVLEVRSNAQSTLDDAFYICALCSKKMDAHTLLAHIKSVPHRLKFSEIHCHDIFAKFGSITLKQWTAVLVKEFTDALLNVEVKFGRHKLAVAYEKDMSVVLASLKSKIEDMTELSLSQKKLDKNSSSRDPKGARKGDHSKSSSPKRKRSRSPRRSPRRRSRERGDRNIRGPPVGPKRRRSRSLSRSHSPRSRRQRSRSRSPRHRSPPRRVERRARHSPVRSRDRSEERKKLVEKRKIRDFRQAEQRLLQSKKEVEEEFDKCPESHPKYNEEWALFWERRYRELEAQGLDPSRHDFKSEWAVFWRKRMKDLNYNYWNNKRNGLLNRFGINDPGPAAVENSGSVNGSGKRQPLSRIDRSPSPWEDDNSRSAKNPSPPPQNSGALNIRESVGSGSDSRSSVAKCEEDYSVIGTLRLLNDLEDHLGSFGPAVATLLSKAVILEEKGENPLDLFKDLDNSVLIRYAKEKLASQISVGILGGQSLAKTEAAIEKSMWLQIQAEKLIGHDKFLGLNITNIAKATMGMDTVQIAQYIAHHLLQIGKSNASEEDLQNILVAVSASHVEMLANPVPVTSNSSTESKATAELNQKKAVDSLTQSSVSVSENNSAAPAPKTALFPSGDPSTQTPTSKTEAGNKSSGPIGLSLLQSAYEDESPKDMNKLSLDDLQALLGNFRSLSREEQQALTTYLKKLEATDSKKVTQLRERMQKSAAKPTPKPSPSQSKPTPSSMSPAPSNEGRKVPVIPPTSNAVPAASHVPSGPPPAAANLNSNTFQSNSRVPPHSPNIVPQQENFPRKFPNHGPRHDHQSRGDVPENRTLPVPPKPAVEPGRGLDDLPRGYSMSSPSLHKEGDPRSKDQPLGQNMPPHPTGFNNPDLRGGAIDGREFNRPTPSEMRENQARSAYNDRERDFQGLFNDKDRGFRGPYGQRELNQHDRFDAQEPGFQGPYGSRGPYDNRESEMHRHFDGEGNASRPFDNSDMIRMRDPMIDRGNPGSQGPGYPYHGFPDQGNPNFQDRGYDDPSRGLPFRDYRDPEYPPRESMGMYDRPGDGRRPVGHGGMPMPMTDRDFNNRFARDGPSSFRPLPFEADDFATDSFRSGAALPQPRGPMQPRGYMESRPPYENRW